MDFLIFPHNNNKNYHKVTLSVIITQSGTKQNKKLQKNTSSHSEVEVTLLEKEYMISASSGHPVSLQKDELFILRDVPPSYTRQKEEGCGGQDKRFPGLQTYYYYYNSLWNKSLQRTLVQEMFWVFALVLNCTNRESGRLSARSPLSY